MPSNRQSQDPSSLFSGLYSDIRDSLKGKARDYTSGSIPRAIIVLSVPMVLEMFMQSIFEVVDIFFVGKLGADAVAAVGLTASLIILIFAVGLGIAMAAGAMVARRIGENDFEGAAKATGQAFWASVVSAIPVGIIAILVADDLLSLMGASSTVIDVGSGYTAILLGGNVTIILLFLFNAIFRAAGDPGVAMRALWLANILNIILDPLFIFGIGPFPEMGVTGAAVASTLGRGIGVAYQIWVLFKGSSRVHIRREHMRLDLDILKRLLRISGPGMLQYLVGTASWMAIMRLMSEFGSASLAGYTIAIRVVIFALLPSWGISNAAATMVGQNLGAQKPERGERAVWICTVLDAFFLGILGAVFWFAAHPILAVFSADPEVVRVGVRCLRILALFFPIWAVGMVTVQAFNGAGDTKTPTWINLFAYWILQIPLAWAFAWPLGMGEEGIFWAIAVAQLALAIIAAIAFRRGRWKTVVV